MLTSLEERRAGPGTRLVVTRVFNAPLELLWNVWTDPYHAIRWWGPAGIAESAHDEGQPDGPAAIRMRAPSGEEFYNTCSHLRLEPMREIDLMLEAMDLSGDPVRPEAIGFPPEFQTRSTFRVSFEAIDADQTRLTVSELS